MVIELQDCHHDHTAFAAMSSVRDDGSTDVTSAYERAIAREEKGLSSDEHRSEVESPQLRSRPQSQAKSESNTDGDSDLYRHHSQQQAAEGG
ncbi:MAG: hypothetical protein H8E93_06125 [Synechococcus sp.]|nr:hypothetical protein [Synechococcus sp.]